MTESNNQWTEDASTLYRELAAVAVPNRAEQIAPLLTLLPFGKDESFRAVELASGEGLLSHALLHAFPAVTLLALDGSETMRQATIQRLRSFESRVMVESFDMLTADWYPQIDGADCVVSSLCIHHLDGAEKQALFAAVQQRLSQRGVFLIADLVLPQRTEGRELFAATWDRSARAQSLEKTGSDELYQTFLDTHWNIYRYPDPMDKPSPLFDQLVWLKEAGFATVDCFWMQAAHAIYGGYKGDDGESSGGIRFKDAMQSAQVALDQ